MVKFGSSQNSRKDRDLAVRILSTVSSKQCDSTSKFDVPIAPCVNLILFCNVCLQINSCDYVNRCLTSNYSHNFPYHPCK